MRRYKRWKTEEVLRYTENEDEVKRSLVRRHYMRWRGQQDPPLVNRCDNLDCIYNSLPLEWNGKELPLILDHIDGCNTNNSVKNLRLLCPNCDSQNRVTRGGANKGRIKKSSGGYAIVRPDSLEDHRMPIRAGRIELVAGAVELRLSSEKDKPE